MSITVERWDADQIKPGSIIALIGKRGSGKSHMALQILYKLRNKIDFAVCMTPTQSSAEAFSRCMPRCLIYDKLDLDAIQRLIDYQSDCLARGKKLRSTLLLLDDTSWEARAFRAPAPVLAFLARNGRHSLLTVLITMQSPLDIGPAIRSQVDYVLTLREAVTQQRKRLYESYYGIIPTFSDFCTVLDMTTESFGALVMLNSVNSNKFQDCLRWYRAKPSLPPFRLVNDCFYFLAQTMKPLPVEDKDQKRQKRGMVVQTSGASTVVSV